MVYKTNNIMNYGEVIKKIRKETVKENQMDFASRLGITQAYLSKIENNVQVPSSTMIKEISKHSGIPLQVVFWQTLTIDDIPKEKKDAFVMVKPMIDELIKSFI